jgi:hypothetical protein
VDVQKKIMPWRLMIPDEEVQDELEYSNRKRDEGGLIVVTSLIDKIPNLGGENSDKKILNGDTSVFHSLFITVS